jgi:hypothetical protein
MFSPSPMKRKREDLNINGPGPRFAPATRQTGRNVCIRELADISDIYQHREAIIDDNQIKSSSTITQLLPSGDLMYFSLLDSEGSSSSMSMSLIINVLEASQRVSITAPASECDFYDLEREVSVLGGEGNARDILACTMKGIILLSTVEADGSVTSCQQSITLTDDKEEVSYVLNAGASYIVGTNRGDIYVIKHNARLVWKLSYYHYDS